MTCGDGTGSKRFSRTRATGCANCGWVLMGGISLALVIACSNLANLLLVRAEGRQQELAVRAALGARRRRIAAGLFSESLILAALGG